MELTMVSSDKDEQGMVKLRRLESRIHDGDAKANRARWESGRELRAMRAAEPDRTLEDIATELGVSRPELSLRMRFAELEEEALVNAVNRSWHDLCQNMAELVGRKRAPRRDNRSTVVKEFSLMLKRVRTTLRKVHAADLTESDFRVLDVLQEEIARIYDELGGGTDA